MNLDTLLNRYIWQLARKDNSNKGLVESKSILNII